MITVFGLGFVGLTTAVGFAHYGEKVYGIDVNEERLHVLQDNQLPFFEPGLDEALKKNNNRNLILTNDVETAINESDFIFYCVGTPYGNNGEADLTYIYEALRDTFKYLVKGRRKILIIKSTIPPSTTKEKIIPFIENEGFTVGKDICVANNPEFLREGHCWEDFIHADRIVIGCDDEVAISNIRRIYEPFNIPIHSVSTNTGEFIKYLSNTMLATMISYANEMSIVADTIGDIQISKAFKILHEDKRWGNATMSSYVYPGCGYGGYCLPKDTNALYALANQKGYNPEILSNVIKVNENMVKYIVNKIELATECSTKIGILGLAFKPNSDDVRDSVSAKVIKGLLDKGYKRIVAYDPVAIQEFKKHYGLEIEYRYDLDDIIQESDSLVILTAWEDFYSIKERYSNKVLDFRYLD